jgi:hypothetical protein
MISWGAPKTEKQDMSGVTSFGTAPDLQKQPVIRHPGRWTSHYDEPSSTGLPPQVFQSEQAVSLCYCHAW